MLSEADVEAILLGQLQALGYTCLIDTVTSNPDGPAPERAAYADVILSARIPAAEVRGMVSAMNLLMSSKVGEAKQT